MVGASPLPEGNMSQRIEKDSLGEVPVPTEAYYGAQTQRAVDNFPISGIRFNRDFIRALGLIKRSAAIQCGAGTPGCGVG